MKLIVNGKSVQADIDDSLHRAVIISLLSWARADDSDEYDGSAYGWWGDSLSKIAGDKVGSKLWLLLRQKLTDDVIAQAKEYAEQSLQWLIDDGLCSSIDVSVERDYDTLNMTITIFLIDSQTTTIKIEDLINGIN
ncbi:MAG: phage GP46 family protein [Succinatimonas sp.]|nr:phage GP46 family protein [Succinatimonas sp.]